MVSSVFPNHMTTAMTSLQLASFWILPQVNNVAAYRINFILDLTHWVHCFFIAKVHIGCFRTNFGWGFQKICGFKNKNTHIYTKFELFMPHNCIHGIQCICLKDGVLLVHAHKSVFHHMHTELCTYTLSTCIDLVLSWLPFQNFQHSDSKQDNCF